MGHLGSKGSTSSLLLIYFRVHSHLGHRKQDAARHLHISDKQVKKRNVSAKKGFSPICKASHLSILKSLSYPALKSTQTPVHLQFVCYVNLSLLQESGILSQRNVYPGSTSRLGTTTIFMHLGWSKRISTI